MFTKRDLLKMMLPTVIQNVMAVTVNTADSIMVASAGEAAVSGVALVGTLDVLLIMMFSSLVSGGAVVASHALGSKDHPLARKCAKQLIYVATGIALLITVLVSIFSRPILNLLYGSAEADVLEHAHSYLRIIVLSFPMLALYDSGAALFRVMGNTVIAMGLSLIMNIINIAGNAVFIFGFGMGTAGAALSTLIARVVGAAAMIALLHNRKNAVYIEKILSYRPDFTLIRKILQIGVPHGIESSMFQFGRLVMQILISTMGTAAIAANSVANTLANYLYMPSGSIENCSVTVVGRCVGAGEKELAKKYAKTLLLWDYIAMWAVSLVLFLFTAPIIGLYELSQEGAQIALQLTVFHAVCTSLIRPPAFVFSSVFKAAGDVWYSLVVSTVSMWVIRVGFAYILALESVTVLFFTLPGMGLGIYGVWIAMMGDWILRTVLFTVRFIRGKWLVRKALV